MITTNEMPFDRSTSYIATRRLTLLNFVIILVFSMATSTAQAARMSDIVERKFVIEGSAAIHVMSFLGFSTDRDAVYTLPWGTDVTTPFRSDCQVKPCLRTNVLRYEAGSAPKVTISGFWFDAETGSGRKVPRYTFPSPRIDSDELSDWRTIVIKHKQDVSGIVEINTDSVSLVRIRQSEIRGHTRFILGIDDR